MLDQGAMETLLQNESFYHGQSSNLIHLAMKLPLSIIKIAHLSCRPLNIYLARNNKFEQIVFTTDEEQRFARCTIFANKFLSSKGLATLPLIHLTPRMLLDYENPSLPPPSAGVPMTNQPIVTSVDISIVNEEDDKSPESNILMKNVIQDELVKKAQRKKRNHRKKSTAIAISGPISCHFGGSGEVPTKSCYQSCETSCIPTVLENCGQPTIEVTVGQLHADQLCEKKLNFDMFSISHKTEYRTVLDKLPKEHHESLYIVSKLFEEYITNIREQYEESLQTLNMRLYLANNSLELKEDELNKLKSSRYK